MTQPAITHHPSPGRPKDMEKRAAILSAAKQLFSAHGFDGVSMAAIAKQADVSKLTVYNHFENKQTLFVAAIHALCEEMVPDTVFTHGTGENFCHDLRLMAQHVYELFACQDTLALRRTIISMLETHPEFGTMFWQEGALRLVEGISAFFKRMNKAGYMRLADDDPTEVAHRFLWLVKGDIDRRTMYAMPVNQPLDQHIKQHLDGVVALFVRAYGTKAVP